MNPLSEDASLLKELYKSCKDVKEKERYQALYLHSIGYHKNEISVILCKDEDTVKAWVDKWLQEKSVRDKSKEGRPPVITKEIAEEITRLVDENDPTNGKLDFSIIDCQFLQVYLSEKYKIQVTKEAIRKKLKVSGYHYLKSEYEFIKRDEEKRKEFIQWIAPLLKDSNIDVNFLDEIRIKLHPKPGYFWTKNKRPIVKTECSHAGLTVKGVINPVTGYALCTSFEKNDRYAHLAFINNFIEVKKPLVESGKVKEVILNLDNLSVHKVHEVVELASKFPWLKINYQPTYSPDLNLIEWLWGHLRKKMLNGKMFKSLDQLRSKLDEIFRCLNPDLIKRVCSVEILESKAQKIGIT